MIKRTAIVHVGLEKTGSTAIQRWLDINHQQLLASGVLIPRSPGFPNHTKLVSACLDTGIVDNIKAYHLFASGCSESRFRTRIFDSLDAEIRSADPRWHTLVISSELISSRLSTGSEIGRLFDCIGRYVDAIRIVIFLRRQDQLALSRFSSILRSGHAQFDDVFVDYSPHNFLRADDERSIGDDLFFYDFGAILQRFATVPNSRLHVHVYGEDEPLDVMARHLSCSSHCSPQAVERQNSALSAEAQYILAHLNASRPVQFPSGMRNIAYRQLQRRVEAEVKGSPRAVSRDQAAQFLSRYEAMNRDTVKQYQLGDGLIPSDLSQYPNSVDYSAFPSLLSTRLASYERLIAAVPSREPMLQVIKYKLRGIKQAASDMLRGMS